MVNRSCHSNGRGIKMDTILFILIGISDTGLVYKRLLENRLMSGIHIIRKFEYSSKGLVFYNLKFRLRRWDVTSLGMQLENRGDR